jgi:hypothetical protein
MRRKSLKPNLTWQFPKRKVSISLSLWIGINLNQASPMSLCLWQIPWFNFTFHKNGLSVERVRVGILTTQCDIGMLKIYTADSSLTSGETITKRLRKWLESI